MSDIDWSTPIRARPLSARPGHFDLVAVRREQLQRAAILIAAAKGRPLTKVTASARVMQLARAVPGLRYEAGGLIWAGLALGALLLDDLPGRRPGAPQRWTDEDRTALAWMIDNFRRTGAFTGSAASDLLPRDRTAEAEALQRFKEVVVLPASVRRLENLLVEGRRLIEAERHEIS